MRRLLRRAWVALLLGAASCGDGGGSGIPGGAPTAAPIPAPAPTLGVPGGLRVSATGSDFIEWSWEAVEGAASYEIQVSAAGDFGAAMATTVTATMHRFAVAPGTTAHARVRALATGVESDWSAAVMGTSDAAPVTVSFVGESLWVEEGETAPVEIRVQVAELAAPLSLAISPLAGTAEAEDYELSATVIEIPAGSGGDETTALTFTAVSDLAIAEGEETLVLRFVPPEGVPAQLGGNLEVVIAEGGGSPCAGVMIRGEPPRVAHRPPHTTVEVLGTTLVMDFLPEAEQTMFDWTGPYRDTPQEGQPGYSPRWAGNRYHSMPEFNVADWSVEKAGVATRHSMRVEWPADTAVALRFRSHEDGCEGEPEAICTGDGCELRG